MRKRRFKIQPLLNISCRWLFGSPYPDTLNIAMDNGTYQKYGLNAQAERICTGKHGWEETGTQVVGYQMKKPSAVTSYEWQRYPERITAMTD